jgi:hypothetical protein
LRRWANRHFFDKKHIAGEDHSGVAGSYRRGDLRRGIELDAITTVVLGEASLTGGTRSVLMTVVGAMLIGVINNGLGLLNVPIETQLIAKGGDYHHGAGHRLSPDVSKQQ